MGCLEFKCCSMGCFGFSFFSCVAVWGVLILVLCGCVGCLEFKSCSMGCFGFVCFSCVAVWGVLILVLCGLSGVQVL